MSMPNRHHFVVDLEPFGLENENEIFRVEDRPYGLIEASISAPDAPPPGPVWEPYPLL
jgi:urate oxidase